MANMTGKCMNRIVAALLLLSAVLLGILVPGGPIETRSFSHIAPVVLGSFNTFLTALGIGSLALVYFALKGIRWAFMASAVSGISYFFVYALDLGKVFPVSPDKMPTTLFIIEVIGSLVSFPLTYLSVKSIHMRTGDSDSHEMVVAIKKKHFLLLALMLLLGIGIIIFATISAMGR